jgi:hypothetical protein
VQDESFTVSNKLSRWFCSKAKQNLLAELLDVGLVVLKKPASSYPTPELVERADVAPISARAEYVRLFNTNNFPDFIGA